MPTPRKAASTRAALIAATIACLTEGGYRRTTTLAVCERAGVTSGALFGQFHNKAALLAAAEDELIARNLDEIATALRSIRHPPRQPRPGDTERPVALRSVPDSQTVPPADDPEPGLRAVFDQLVIAYARPLPATVAELWISARHDPRLARALTAANATTIALIEEALRAAIAQIASAPSIRAVALLIHAAALSQVAWTLSSGPSGRGAATGQHQADRDFHHAIAILARRSQETASRPAQPEPPAARMLVKALLARVDGDRPSASGFASP